MALSLARTAVAIGAAWVAIGALFAIAFASVGAGRIDHEAKSAGVGFRVLIFPASVALWPLLLWRWIKGNAEAPRERNAHRDQARGLER
jgi:hypothetical protein